MEANNAMPTSADNTKKILRLGLILFAVTAITGLILGVVYEITKAPIAATQARLKTEALAGALPEAEAFTQRDLVPGADPNLLEVQEAQSGGQLVGYCIATTSKGYAGPIDIVIGITHTGTLRAIRILNQSETPGLGAKAPEPAFSGQFENKDVEHLTVVKTPASTPDQIQAISGATITSDAVANGVNIALDYWRDNLKGGK